MKFWFALIQVTELNADYLNAKIPMYFSITVCNFLSLRAFNSCYFFPLCFLHVFNLVYNGSEFIFLCSSHCFRHSPNFSSKVGVEFILVVLYIDGLSLFFNFHKTRTYRLWVKCYLSLVDIPYAYFSMFLGIFDSISQYIFNLFRPPIPEIHSVTIYMVLPCMCERSFSGNGEASSLS